MLIRTLGFSKPNNVRIIVRLFVSMESRARNRSNNLYDYNPRNKFNHFTYLASDLFLPGSGHKRFKIYWHEDNFLFDVNLLVLTFL